MGLIHIELFATLDLVGQSPGSPDEGPVGFPFGGWQAPLMDEYAGAQVSAAYEGTDALLLGRRTHDIFAAYWPHQEGEFATLFNRVPKYVASRGRPDLSWAGSVQVGPDLAGAEPTGLSHEPLQFLQGEAISVRPEVQTPPLDSTFRA